MVRDLASDVFTKRSRQESVVFACLAVVIAATESDDATVRLLNSPEDGSQDFTARNKTGEALVEGDSVWLHYWGDYTNAYIAIRNWEV